MPVSVVTVTFNSAEVIEGCVGSAVRLLPGAEIVVVDNGSADDTVARARAAGASAVLEGHGNVGFGRACNLGAQTARRSHVLFMNPDVVLREVDAQRLTALMDDAPFGIAAPLLGEEAGARAVGHVMRGRRPLLETFDHALGPLLPRGLSRGVRLAGEGRRGWASGALLLASRAEFLALGGFDERLFMYYEDRDLSRRYHAAGMPVRATAALTGTHISGRSSAPSGLGAERMAYSLLGWIEYLAIWEGEAAATRSAHIASRLLAGTQPILAAAARAPGASRRLARKGAQLAELLALLSGERPLPIAPEPPVYPRALRIFQRGARS